MEMVQETVTGKGEGKVEGKKKCYKVGREKDGIMEIKESE